MPHRMINGCNLAFAEHGTGKNTVLFVHDLFFTGQSFHQQILALRDRYRCVTLDLRGHGQSEVCASDFSLNALSEDVNQLISTQQYGACHLVGAGYGGVIAVKAALEHPERVNSLTLIGSSLGQSCAKDIQSLTQRRLQIRLFGLRFVVPALMRRAFSPEFIEDPRNATQVNHFKLEFRKLDRYELPRCISGYLSRPSLLDDLYKLKQPSLIVGGTRDSVLSRDDLTLARNRLEPSRLLLIEDSGHSVHIEKANEFNTELQEFLRSV